MWHCFGEGNGKYDKGEGGWEEEEEVCDRGSIGSAHCGVQVVEWVLESMPELKATRRHKCSTRRIRFEPCHTALSSEARITLCTGHPLLGQLSCRRRVPRPALPACGEVKWRRGVGGEGTSGHTHARYRPVNTNRKKK